MKLIELTKEMPEGESIYVSVDSILSLEKRVREYDDNIKRIHTTIRYKNDSGYLWVKESPDEVLQKIKEEV